MRLAAHGRIIVGTAARKRKVRQFAPSVRQLRVKNHHAPGSSPTGRTTGAPAWPARKLYPQLQRRALPALSSPQSGHLTLSFPLAWQKRASFFALSSQPGGHGVSLACHRLIRRHCSERGVVPQGKCVALVRAEMPRESPWFAPQQEGGTASGPRRSSTHPLLVMWSAASSLVENLLGPSCAPEASPQLVFAMDHLPLYKRRGAALVPSGVLNVILIIN